jgi:uncharacterized membrane protein
MNKIEFLAAVSARLDGLAPADVREQIGFLSEMIDDRMEEGSTEAEAVAALGTPDEVAARILADVPFATVTEAPAKPKKRSVLRTVLLAATSPIWASLLFAFIITAFCLIVTLGTVGAVGVGFWYVAKYLCRYSVAGVKIALSFVSSTSK